MHFTSTLTAAGVIAAGLVQAAPYSPFPLADGFPSPDATSLAQIELAAGGNLPNGALPTSLTAGAITTLQLIALNELFEVAYFNELLLNVTNVVEGYDVTTWNYTKQHVVDILTAVVKQEELHAAGANGILKNAGATTISPCQYSFPVSDFKSAITLANTFTDLVLSVLPGAQTTFAKDGGDELGLVGLVGSIIAQEGEQNGYYRLVQKKTPSAAPFLTASAPQFAFTALQSFIVAGSCPDSITQIGTVGGVTTFQALNVETAPGEGNSTVTFAVSGTVTAGSNSVVYLSGQIAPVTVPITNVQSQNGLTYFDAEFPFLASTGQFSRGLTVAAVVNGSDTFANATTVAAATVYGPGLIEVD